MAAVQCLIMTNMDERVLSTLSKQCGAIMKMIRIGLNQMSISQLDYAAALIQGWELVGGNWVKGGSVMCGPASEYKPSKDWRQLGGLIDLVNQETGGWNMDSSMLLFQSLTLLSKEINYLVPDQKGA